MIGIYKYLAAAKEGTDFIANVRFYGHSELPDSLLYAK
jgi:hypothetical protein